MNYKKTIELFAGSQSFTKVAKELNCETFTSDIKDLQGINYVIDILTFDVNRVPFIPDIIWASPDCSTWSKAAGSIHFDGKKIIPKTEKAVKSILIIEKTLQIIFHFLSINPGLKYYIENPEGKLQKYLQAGTLFGNINRLVVLDQCQYGREFKKRTHIFTNDFQWKPRKLCKGKQFCTHKSNIQNSGLKKTSSLGLLDKLQYYQRAMIPRELCLEILTVK